MIFELPTLVLRSRTQFPYSIMSPCHSEFPFSVSDPPPISQELPARPPKRTPPMIFELPTLVLRSRTQFPYSIMSPCHSEFPFSVSDPFTTRIPHPMSPLFRTKFPGTAPAPVPSQKTIIGFAWVPLEPIWVGFLGALFIRIESASP